MNTVMLREVLPPPGGWPSGGRGRRAEFQCPCGNKFVRRVSDVVKAGRSRCSGCKLGKTAVLKVEVLQSFRFGIPRPNERQVTLPNDLDTLDINTPIYDKGAPGILFDHRLDDDELFPDFFDTFQEVNLS